MTISIHLHTVVFRRKKVSFPQYRMTQTDSLIQIKHKSQDNKCPLITMITLKKTATLKESVTWIFSFFQSRKII